MAGRVQQDTFIDDSDETCPLCVEEFDLSDRNFRPCPCGYQVCQFCFNNIKNNMNGLCPACRRPYDEKSIEWKVVSPEEFKADVQKQARKKAEIRQKEAQKREVESQNRKHLSGLRVVQKNLVYVVGLNPRIREEDLLQTLRGEQYFGQYGKIVKIVVSKARDGGQGNQPLGVYVTFARVQDAERCIAAVDGSENGGRTLRAQFGTTKYCSAYLRNEQCMNKSCMFLHEAGEEKDSFTRQDLSSINVVSTQRPAQQSDATSAGEASSQAQSQHPPQRGQDAVTAATQPMGRLPSKDGTISPVDSGDGSALPTSASWGKQGQQQSRRASASASTSTPSPHIASASLPSQSRDTAKKEATAPDPIPEQADEKYESTPGSTIRSKGKGSAESLSVPLLNQLLKSISSPEFKFVFSTTMFSPEEYDAIVNHPALLDPDGGARRRAARASEHEELRADDDQAKKAAQASADVQQDEVPGSGSLQLGGEPEDGHEQGESGARADLLAATGQDQQQRAVQPPTSGASVPSFAFGQTHGPDALSSLLTQARSFTPSQQQQQQQLSSLKPGDPQSALQGLAPQNQHLQSGLFQNQTQQLAATGHARQSSRYTFANDSASASAAVKPAANAKLMAQQSAMMPGNQNQHPQQYGGQYATGAAHGPPPGLKSTGTPPTSGGGMFGQGHGFAGAMSTGPSVGRTSTTLDEKSELLRDMFRSRGGASGVGNGQAPDAAKREYMFPSFLQQYPTSTTPTPAPGLLGTLHGSQAGVWPDHGPQKQQKKKGKKHRHANTSSSGGGGIVNLADPSILQARMQPQASTAAGQGFFGGQGQGGYNPGLMYGGGFGRW
ncbi:MAG: transcriptional repressor general negative regulator of transcription subunit 4 [Thelocarpon impressellum]|nr:MAG: transcriptional repressor general negative regulator of transcription subunit 4 [Thelocarpon impressellum]